MDLSMRPDDDESKGKSLTQPPSGKEMVFGLWGHFLVLL